jgi:hypothetical protein
MTANGKRVAGDRDPLRNVRQAADELPSLL